MGLKMARDPRAQGVVALHRFGLPPKLGSTNSIGDTRSVLLAELDRPGAALIKNNDLLTSGEAARAAFDFRQERKAARLAANAQNEADKQQAKQAGSPDDKQPAKQDNAAKPNPGPGVPQQIYLEETKARLETALAADAGFVERLVCFWSNHFCISADKGGVRPLCGAYEREAIRPHDLLTRCVDASLDFRF